MTNEELRRFLGLLIPPPCIEAFEREAERNAMTLRDVVKEPLIAASAALLAEEIQMHAAALRERT